MSGRRQHSVSVGHDAFLDIVANLVGILIILVVVLGAQSQAVIREANEKKQEVVDPRSLTAGEQDMDALAMAATQAAAAQADSVRLENTIKVMDQKIEKRSEQRSILLALLSEAEAAWEDEKQKLDSQRLEAAEKDAAAGEIKTALSELEGERERLENSQTPVVAISHLPTPMAKTVFGKEIHLRLKDNRLSVVPIEQLTQEIRNDLRRMASGSNEGVMDAAIGPVRGYVARYVVSRRNELMRQGGGISRVASFQVMAASFDPLQEPHGAPIGKVLENEDFLAVELAGQVPGNTTVTVWVYPDSYGSFRKLKEKLYTMGYATAARPLEFGRSIIASPSGSKSAAQ